MPAPPSPAGAGAGYYYASGILAEHAELPALRADLAAARSEIELLEGQKGSTVQVRSAAPAAPLRLHQLPL